MPASAVQVIRSRSNPLLVQLRQLAQDDVEDSGGGHVARLCELGP